MFHTTNAFRAEFIGYCVFGNMQENKCRFSSATSSPSNKKTIFATVFPRPYLESSLAAAPIPAGQSGLHWFRVKQSELKQNNAGNKMQEIKDLEKTGVGPFHTQPVPSTIPHFPIQSPENICHANELGTRQQTQYRRVVFRGMFLVHYMLGAEKCNLLQHTAPKQEYIDQTTPKAGARGKSE